ncbi:unnamed protein product [Rotaria sordida]|uniref:Uncharacterized protein n=1 Tax=Rotaria sordida TaxID=392033 RepID=A0A814ZEJ7_9BILA|nr:unnamed protein product [Rotaria sordida]
MANNQLDINSLPIYKLFFDDIEEIFLNTVSFRVLNILFLITCLFTIGILVLLFYRSQELFLTSLIPFIYTLIFYDFIQLLSLILLKYNATEYFLNQLCRWPYYLKSSSDAGQCLTIIFIFALSRYHIRYFITHNNLSNTSHIHSRALVFVCLLFIVYDNNWITHLKVEKVHLITLNETKYEINVQELPISLYDITEIQMHSHQRFITDLDKYSRGYEKNIIIQNQQKITKDKFIHNNNDGSIHAIIIKFPSDYFLNTIKNRTKRILKDLEEQEQLDILNQTIDENEYNNSYRINRCTYGQTNFFLTNFLSLIHSICYFILILYYLIIIYAYKITDTSINYHKQFYEKSFKFRKQKSIERHKQFILLTHLKHFLYIIIYLHTLFTLIRLIYVCSLTIILCFVETPFKWLPIKIFFYCLFLISYFSIPLRMSLLFIFCFLTQFSKYIRSIIFYLFHTNLRFSWKLEKPTICFRLRFTPYNINSNQNEQRINSLVLDLSSSMIEDQSTIIPQDSIVMYNESSGSYNGVTTTILTSPNIFVNETTSPVCAMTKL